MPPLPPPRPVPPPPTLPSSSPVVGLDGDEASEEEDRVKDRDREAEKGDIESKKRRKRKVVDWGNSDSVSSGANSDGPENGTCNLTAFLTLETEVFGECRSKLKTKGSTLEIWGGSLLNRAAQFGTQLLRPQKCRGQGGDS